MNDTQHDAVKAVLKTVATSAESALIEGQDILVRLKAVTKDQLGQSVLAQISLAMLDDPMGRVFKAELPRYVRHLFKSDDDLIQIVATFLQEGDIAVSNDKDGIELRDELRHQNRVEVVVISVKLR